MELSKIRTVVDDNVHLEDGMTTPLLIFMTTILFQERLRYTV